MLIFLGKAVILVKEEVNLKTPNPTNTHVESLVMTPIRGGFSQAVDK